MIRTVRRMGDAISNITATVGPAEGMSLPVTNYIQASLSAQGLNPATATPAQIQSAYNSFASQQTFANLAPVYGQPSAPAQIASAAIAAATAPPAPAAAQLPAVVPVLPQQSGSTLSYNQTADAEMIANTLRQYGDSWDSVSSLQARLYAQGIVPGTINQAQVLSVANLTSETATTPATSSFSFAALPWYAWAGAAGIGLLLFGKK